MEPGNIRKRIHSLFFYPVADNFFDLCSHNSTIIGLKIAQFFQMFDSWWMNREVVAMGANLGSFLSLYGLPTNTGYFVPKDITLLGLFVKQEECNLKTE